MSKEERQAAQITIWMENGQIHINYTGNMAPAMMIAAMETLKFKLLSGQISRRDPMIVPGMLRGDLKRVPS